MNPNESMRKTIGSFIPARDMARKRRMRFFFYGPELTRKTRTALAAASRVGGPIALICPVGEVNNVPEYADEWNFHISVLPDTSPASYAAAIHEAVDNGFAVIIVDSITPAWDTVKRAVAEAADKPRGNSQLEWGRTGNPMHRQLIDALTTPDCHIIAISKAKQAVVVGSGEKGAVRQRITLEPDQRSGMPGHFNVSICFSAEGASIEGMRAENIYEGRIIPKPDENTEFLDFITRGFAKAASKAKQSKQPATKAPDLSTTAGKIAFVRARIEERARAEGAGDIPARLRNACRTVSNNQRFTPEKLQAEELDDLVAKLQE